MKKLLAIAAALLGLAAVAAIPFIVGVDATFAAIRRLGWAGLAAVVGNASLVLIAPGIAWWILMRGEEVRVSPWQTLKACFMGFPVNMLTPSAQVGAEPLKTIYIARVSGAPKRQVLATVIVAKVQEAVGLVLGAVASCAIVLATADLSRSQRISMALVTGAMALVLALVIVGFCLNAQPTVRIVQWIACLGFRRRRMARLRRHAREMESMIHACFVHRPGRFLAAQAVTLASAASNFLRPWIFFAFAGGSVSLEHLAGLYLVMNGINLIAFTPGSLGLFEGGMIGYFVKAGFGKEAGAAYALSGRFADITLLMAGVALILQAGLMRAAKGKETDA